MKDLESLESTQGKLQGDRPSPETPCWSQSNLRVPHELMTLIGSIRSKNSTFCYGAAWALRFRSLTPIMAPVQISKKQTVVGNTYFKVFFHHCQFLNVISNSVIMLSLMCWKSHMLKLQN